MRNSAVQKRNSREKQGKPVRISGFLIPALAAALLGLAFSSFLTSQEDGVKPAAWMGVSVNILNQAEKADLGLKWGVRVVSVERESAADKAGIEEDDVLLTFNGEKIRQAIDLPEMVGEHAPGDTVEVTLMRDRQKKTVTLTLGERTDRPILFPDEDERGIVSPEGPEFKWKEAKRAYLGIGMQMVEGDVAGSFGLKHKTGVVVRSLEEDGPAAKAGIKAGDLLFTVGTQKIENASDVYEGLAKSKPGDKIDITVQRHGKSRTVTVTLGEQESPQRSLLDQSNEPAYPSESRARTLEPSRQNSDSINLLGQDTDTTVQSNQLSHLADRILGNWDNHLSGATQAACTVSKQNGKYVVMGQDKFGTPFGAVLRYDTVIGNPKGSFRVHFKVEQCLGRSGWRNAGDAPCLYEYSDPASGDTFYDYKYSGAQENFFLVACGQLGPFRR